MAIIPGEWRVYTRDSGVTVVQSTHDGEEYMVARCYGDGDGDVISTASLIAAAPPLLFALRSAVNALNVAPRFRVGGTTSYAVAAMCDQAIAKAEGRGE